jgi:hypothetical protein
VVDNQKYYDIAQAYDNMGSALMGLREHERAAIDARVAEGGSQS